LAEPAGFDSAAGLSALLVSVPDFSAVDVVDEVSGLRLSVTYQPEPLKMIPTGWNTRRTDPPHSGQVVSGASAKLWRASKRFLHFAHSYS
jgi:hypothetical protein